MLGRYDLYHVMDHLLYVSPSNGCYRYAILSSKEIIIAVRTPDVIWDCDGRYLLKDQLYK